MPVGACLSDDTLVALLDGKLSTADRDTLKTHLDACADCRALVAETVRSAAPVEEAAPAVLAAGQRIGPGRVCLTT